MEPTIIPEPVNILYPCNDFMEAKNLIQYYLNLDIDSELFIENNKMRRIDNESDDGEYKLTDQKFKTPRLLKEQFIGSFLYSLSKRINFNHIDPLIHINYNNYQNSNFLDFDDTPEDKYKVLFIDGIQLKYYYGLIFYYDFPIDVKTWQIINFLNYLNFFNNDIIETCSKLKPFTIELLEPNNPSECLFILKSNNINFFNHRTKKKIQWSFSA